MVISCVCMTLIMCSKMIFVHEPFTTYGTGEFEFSFVEAFMEFEIIDTAKFPFHTLDPDIQLLSA